MVTNKPSTPRAVEDRNRRRRFAEMDAAYARQAKLLRRIARAARSQLKKGHDDAPHTL
jgi:hypothetical protein